MWNDSKKFFIVLVLASPTSARCMRFGVDSTDSLVYSVEPRYTIMNSTLVADAE